MDDNTQNTAGDGLDTNLDNSQVQGNDSDNSVSELKNTKEENFNGVVKKLNATLRENKALQAKIAETEAKLESLSKKDDKKTSKESEQLQELQTQLSQLINEQKEEKANQALATKLQKAEIDNKYIESGVAKSILEATATENYLDLNNPNDFLEAIKLFKASYPELLQKSAKALGVLAGQTASNNVSVSETVLDGKGEDYFSLTQEQKDALAKKILTKK